MSTKGAFAVARRYALSVTLLLVAGSMLLSTWTVLEAASTAGEVQAERSASIVRMCVAQNVRHVDTIKELDVLVGRAEAKASRSQRVQIAQGRASTVLLINALAPYRNCQRVLAANSTK